MIKKNSTCEATKNLTEFPRSRLMPRFDKEIDARKPAEDSVRSVEGQGKAYVTARWRESRDFSG
eukprot:scaffold1507_cov53-Cyclotella_meneghiniana.AAC.1